MNKLQNKVVLITGAASGIGKATALALLQEGARVFDSSLRQRLADEHPSESLKSFNGDVGNEADVQEAFRQCIDAFGTVDVLINNAGLGIPTPDLAETDLDTYERMVNTNMRGVFLCNREALKIRPVISSRWCRWRGNAPIPVPRFTARRSSERGG